MIRARTITVLAVAALACVACSNSDVDESTSGTDTTLAETTTDVNVKPEPSFDGTIAKRGAPFTVSYNVIGTPIVGSPVTVDLRVTSTLGSHPVKVSYRINDASAMRFHEAQPSEVEMTPNARKDFVEQQVTVIPQREGRLYLNVGASVETENGSKSSVMAIPIQVGSDGRTLDENGLEENGEVQLDENGEAIRVLTNE